MSAIRGITLAICTRNRHDDLERCIASIAKQQATVPLEVLIVDDGDLPAGWLEQIENKHGYPRGYLRYIRKSEKGLFLSRIEAIRKSTHDIVLFVDDDIVLADDYLSRLAELYERNPSWAGIGGRDLLIGRGGWSWRLFCGVFLYGSSKPGKLSLSGYGGAMIKWGAMKAPFRTEYMLGCNMSFRKSALAGVAPVDWLSDYSLGEDIYLSIVAGRSGQLWIDPALTVTHLQSVDSRDRMELVAYTEIVNHYHLLRTRRRHPVTTLLLLWTSCGLLLRAAIRTAHRAKAFGYLRAMRDIVRGRRGRSSHENIAHYGNR
ncbi:glycosyltransferase family 2 protein [Cohnella soli]|uniref:Glycosyltransferase family 2 protein n=1 Tax=Cohnella soli TaxID=425005 RepID=A0ABW0HXF5_9BACL